MSALFLLVVLAALGAYMVTLSGTQHHTTMLGLQGAKAYHAARAGMEWGAAQAVAGSCAAATIHPQGALAGFVVDVRCMETTHNEQGSSAVVLYTITSVSRFGTPGDPAYARRVVRTKVVGG